MAGLFAEKLQDMVAEYRVIVSQEMMELTFNVPAEHMGDAMQLIAEVLHAPDINAEDIEAIRATAGRVRRYGNGLGGARALFEDIILGNHAYSRTPAAEEAQRLTTTDVETFHRGFFVPRNVVLALSGDFVAEDARTALNAHFGDWKGGRAPKMKQAAPVETAPGRQIHTYPLDTRQAWIAIGHEISPVSQEARPALDVMNYILGGSISTHASSAPQETVGGLQTTPADFLSPVYGTGDLSLSHLRSA